MDFNTYTKEFKKKARHAAGLHTLTGNLQNLELEATRNFQAWH